MRDAIENLQHEDFKPSAASCKQNLKSIEVRVARCTVAAEYADSRTQYLEHRRNYAIETGKQLHELHLYADFDPMDALRYLLSRVRRVVGDIDASEFIDLEDKRLVTMVQDSYDELIKKFVQSLGDEVVDSVFSMFDLGNKEFALRYYIAVMRCYDERRKQGLFGGNRVKRRIQQINEQYGLSDHIAVIQIGAKVKHYEQEIIPFLESMLRSERLDDDGKIFDKSVEELDQDLHAMQTQLVKLRNKMFDVGFYNKAVAEDMEKTPDDSEPDDEHDESDN